MAAGSGVSGVSGTAVAATAAGGILLWSGIKGASVTSALRSLVSGKKPSGVLANPLTSGAGAGGSAAAGDTSAHGQSAAVNQNTARLSVIISHPSWAQGQEWAEWVSLWNRESGWNNLALNPSSGAFGIAQALGHGAAGAAGKYGNQYPSKAANDGDALAQIQWGISYIAQTYGSPSAAWAHEQSAGWY